MSSTPVLEERAVARHPHLTRPRRPGRVRMDCHLHTLRTGDSVTTLEELRDLAAETGLDVIAVTDHHTLSGALRLREEVAGVRIAVGEEIRTRDGEIFGTLPQRAGALRLSPPGSGPAHPRTGRGGLRTPSLRPATEDWLLPAAACLQPRTFTDRRTVRGPRRTWT
jgi:hypothetical protein